MCIDRLHAATRATIYEAIGMISFTVLARGGSREDVAEVLRAQADRYDPPGDLQASVVVSDTEPATTCCYHLRDFNFLGMKKCRENP